MQPITIGNRKIGPGHPVYVIAEMSANHGQDKGRALEIIRAAKDAGADAVKIQTYTADTMTLACENEYFLIKGTIWEGKTLHDLYGEAHTPWEWQPELKAYADSIGIDLFSSPFDFTAVDFLEEMGVPAYKVASFELVDIPLLGRIARTGKPVIMSTGMGTLEEIEEAVAALKDNGCTELAILKCTSAYPATPDEANLATIVDLADRFGVPVGLSDHTLGPVPAVAATALGACIVEKHFTLSRAEEGPDSKFSIEPDEFRRMVDDIRTAESALGRPFYGPTPRQRESLMFRRSLFVAKDVKKGERFTADNIRSIRPANGMHTRYFDRVCGMTASADIERGTPLTTDLITDWKE